MAKPPGSPQFNKPQHAARNSLKQNALKIVDSAKPRNLPWAQGVESSNLAAPTKCFIFSILLYQTGGARRQSAPVSGAVDRLATLDSAELV